MEQGRTRFLPHRDHRRSPAQARLDRQRLVDAILDEAEQKGTGRWTAQSALDLGVPLTSITEAVYARALSGRREQRIAVAEQIPAPKVSRRNATKSDVDAICDALYASKIIAYAQGFEQLTAASEEFGWNLKFGEIASLWRGGCIIRARFLKRIREAYDADERIEISCCRATFATPSWRRSRRGAALSRSASSRACPTPAFSSSLAYFDGLRRARGPANLLQGLRDYFGAHTYRRLDKPGSFHTRWAQDGEEASV